MLNRVGNPRNLPSLKQLMRKSTDALKQSNATLAHGLAECARMF